ncbi:hypothetical protein [Acidithiobacillus ferridurans]
MMLSDDPAILRDPAKIAELLMTHGAGGAGTVSFDSLTAILKPLNAMAVTKNRSGSVKNKASSFIEKANAMELILGAVTATGVDTTFIWHLEDGKDANGKDIVHETISTTELAKMHRCLNAVIRIGKDFNLRKRYAEVIWNREGVRKQPDGKPLIFYDELGWWKGVPEQIEAALYAGVFGTESRGGEPTVHAHAGAELEVVS